MTQADISKMTQAELIALVYKMRSAPANRLSLKVTDKGGVSCYGLGRFPVTLYLSQWERLLAAASDITAFIEANRASLATKD